MRGAKAVAGVALLLGGMIGGGCVSRRAPETSEAQLTRQWTATLDAALAASGDGRYGDADKTIAEFEHQHAGSSLAAEALYWRALLALHPANRNGSPRQASDFLDRYLATRQAPRRREAQALKRIATQLRSVSPDTSEVVKLRGELAKAQEELDLIKKRLAQPRP